MSNFFLILQGITCVTMARHFSARMKQNKTTINHHHTPPRFIVSLSMMNPSLGCLANNNTSVKMAESLLCNVSRKQRTINYCPMLVTLLMAFSAIHHPGWLIIAVLEMSFSLWQLAKKYLWNDCQCIKQRINFCQLCQWIASYFYIFFIAWCKQRWYSVNELWIFKWFLFCHLHPSQCLCSLTQQAGRAWLPPPHRQIFIYLYVLFCMHSAWRLPWHHVVR